jgi:hypothetical protein
MPSALTATIGRPLSAADPIGQQAARPPRADRDIGGSLGDPEISAAECNSEVPVADAGRSGHLDCADAESSGRVCAWVDTLSSRSTY